MSRSKRIFKPTVTIGIPAHNEAANIAKMLRSLLAQTAKNYELQQIFVLCDGCTDNTVQIVNTFAHKYRFIKVINDGRHIGKNSRLNQLFRISKSAICVVLDADVAIADRHVIEELIKPFAASCVGLVSGNDKPCGGASWFETIAITFYEIWYEIRKNLNGGDSIHNIHGPIYAVRNKVYTQVRLLTTVNADDQQTYFWNKKLGFEMVFGKSATVYYRMPKTLGEYLVQHTRYLVGFKEFNLYYGNWIKSLYPVPFMNTVNGILTVFLRKPHIVLAALGLQVALRFIKMTTLKNTSRGMWQSIKSSKVAIHV